MTLLNVIRLKPTEVSILININQCIWLYFIISWKFVFDAGHNHSNYHAHYVSLIIWLNDGPVRVLSQSVVERPVSPPWPPAVWCSPPSPDSRLCHPVPHWGPQPWSQTPSRTLPASRIDNNIPTWINFSYTSLSMMDWRVVGHILRNQWYNAVHNKASLFILWIIIIKIIIMGLSVSAKVPPAKKKITGTYPKYWNRIF